MQCCGPLHDVTTMSDRTPVYICGECGKVGTPSEFPDPQPEPPKLTRFNRVRYQIAEWLDQIAHFIAPK